MTGEYILDKFFSYRVKAIERIFVDKYAEISSNFPEENIFELFIRTQE
jgi:hypothetical protein